MAHFQRYTSRCTCHTENLYVVLFLTCVDVVDKTVEWLHRLVLFTNIDLKLRNKSHGPMHYKIGVTFEFKYLITYLIFTENSRSVKKWYISNTVFINVSHR